MYNKEFEESALKVANSFYTFSDGIHKIIKQLQRLEGDWAVLHCLGDTKTKILVEEARSRLQGYMNAIAAIGKAADYDNHLSNRFDLVYRNECLKEEK